MRIAVIGAGGVGGYFGARLAAAGHDVWFVARGAHLAAMQKDGLTVASPLGDIVLESVNATSDIAQIGVVDYVLLAVKSWQFPSVLSALPGLLGPSTAVVTTQNGVSAPDEVAEVIGRDAVLPGAAMVIAYIEEPGLIRHVGAGALTFGEWDNHKSPRVLALQEALQSAGAKAMVPDDIWSALWAKFSFIAPVGGLGSVTDAPLGILRSRPGTRRLLIKAMEEVQLLAADHGVSLPEDIVARNMASVDGEPPEATSSMQRDLAAGRPTELETWSGAVVRLAAKSGTPVPTHEFIYEVLAVRAAEPPEPAAA